MSVERFYVLFMDTLGVPERNVLVSLELQLAIENVLKYVPEISGIRSHPDIIIASPAISIDEIEKFRGGKTGVAILQRKGDPRFRRKNADCYKFEKFEAKYFALTAQKAMRMVGINIPTRK